MPQDEQDASQRSAVGHTRQSTVVADRSGREQRLDRFPEIVADRVCVGHYRAYAIRPADRKNSLCSPTWLIEMTSKPATWTPADRHYEQLRIRLEPLFRELGIAAA